MRIADRFVTVVPAVTVPARAIAAGYVPLIRLPCGRTGPLPAPARQGASGSAPRTMTAGTKTVLVEGVRYVVTASMLNLRAEPDIDAEMLRVLETGDAVTVLELMDGQWARVSSENASLGDLECYVAKAYLGKR
ncbi:SH3 domain-containing protein [Hymenobacter actinosclerus]|uniref:SH3 domain-containing protein n=2 Tax=Hymenobacter actinosclerus TaxID=82805 RepID=A0A1I0IEX2_9BACT|nr:SH3 domain-containing protein [Hymenobacter actinosclerus]